MSKKHRSSNKKDSIDVRHVAILIAVTLIMIALLYHRPNYTYDDAKYICFANEIRAGTFNALASPWAYGYLYPYTVAASYYTFGPANLSATLPAMIEYIGLVLITYALAARILNPRIGIISAFSLSISAFVAAYSSRVLPDMLTGLLIALSLYVYLTKKGQQYALLSGVITGMLIFVKIGDLIALIAIAVAVLVLHERKRALWFYTGAGITLLFYFLSLGGNAGIIHAYAANQLLISHVKLGTNLATMTYVMFLNYGLTTAAFGTVFPLGLLLVFALAGSALAARDRNRNLLLMAVLLWLFYLYMFLGTESLSGYHLITVESRYFIAVATPMALLAGYFLFWVESKFRDKTTKTGILILMVFLLLLSNAPMIAVLHYNSLRFPFSPLTRPQDLITANAIESGPLACAPASHG